MTSYNLIDLMMIFLLGAATGIFVLIIFAIKDFASQKKMKVLIKKEQEKNNLKRDKKGRFIKEVNKQPLSIHDKDVSRVWVYIVGAFTLSGSILTISTAVVILLKMII